MSTTSTYFAFSAMKWFEKVQGGSLWLNHSEILFCGCLSPTVQTLACVMCMMYIHFLVRSFMCHEEQQSEVGLFKCVELVWKGI